MHRLPNREETRLLQNILGYGRLLRTEVLMNGWLNGKESMQLAREFNSRMSRTAVRSRTLLILFQITALLITGGTEFKTKGFQRIWIFTVLFRNTVRSVRRRMQIICG